MKNNSAAQMAESAKVEVMAEWEKLKKEITEHMEKQKDVSEGELTQLLYEMEVEYFHKGTITIRQMAQRLLAKFHITKR